MLRLKKKENRTLNSILSSEGEGLRRVLRLPVRRVGSIGGFYAPDGLSCPAAGMFGLACVQDALEPIDYESAGECAQKKAGHGDAVVLSASGKAQDDEDQDSLYVGDEFHRDFLLDFNVLNFRILSRAANAAYVQGVETGMSCSVCVEPC